MEDFPFNFNLSYQSEDYIVKPPTGLFQLKDLITKKYNIEIENMVHIPENGKKMEIKNEQDYADLIQYASDSNLKEVVIFINREIEEENEEGEDNKGEEEENEEEDKKEKFKGKDKKHNKGFKEKKRIGYIKEKKQMQRDETMKEEEEMELAVSTATLPLLLFLSKC